MSNLVSIKKIIADENQPRKYFDPAKLVAMEKSIKAHGIMNPLSVQMDGDNYLLVDGERRFRAAKNLGLKEVPITVMETTDPMTRMIEQFHIQQMHEDWTPSEEAFVIGEVMTASGKPFLDVCRILNIAPNRAKRLHALSKLADREEYGKMGIPLEYAETMGYLNSFVKKLKMDNEESFPISEQKKLERAVITNIASGEFKGKNDITKLKDTFKSDYKTIEKFVAGANADELFIKSKAQAMFHYRNAMNSANYIGTHIRNFLNNPNCELNDTDAQRLISVRDLITQLLQKAGKDE